VEGVGVSSPSNDTEIVGYSKWVLMIINILIHGFSLSSSTEKSLSACCSSQVPSCFFRWSRWSLNPKLGMEQHPLVVSITRYLPKLHGSYPSTISILNPDLDIYNINIQSWLMSMIFFNILNIIYCTIQTSQGHDEVS
jgi:hypothetical protein